MLKSLVSSRLGKYYSTVSKKYGVIAPFAVAALVFMVICAISEFKVFELIADNTVVNVITIISLVFIGLLGLYYMFSKLICDEVNAADFIMSTGAVLAALMLVRLFFAGATTGFIIAFVVELVLLILFAIARAAVVIVNDEDDKVYLTANSTLKTYFTALAKRTNLFFVAVLGAAIFALAFLIDGSGLEFGTTITAFAIALVFFVGALLFSIPRRVSSKQIGQVDSAIWTLIVATVLYAITVALNFTVLKLVIWLALLAVLVMFAVLIGKNTHIGKERRVSLAGDKGFKVYLGQLAGKCNLVLAALVGLIGFVVTYALIGINVFFGLATRTSEIFHGALVVLALAGIAALLIAARNRRVGSVDFVLFALCVYAVLAIIPTAQFFDVFKLIGWALLVVVVAFAFAIRVISVRSEELEVKELYNPAHIFNGYNCKFVSDNIKSFFMGEKDAHYISRKESRMIARTNMRTIKEYEARKRRKNVPESEYLTKMRDDRNVVEFENLHTYFFSDAGVVKAVNGVSFDIPQGSTVGVIGESGCGKSVTSLSLMQLVQAPKGQVMEGSEIRFKSTVYKEDENGNKIPVYEVKRDADGNEIKDENGNVVYETAPRLDKKGNPVLDKDGKPIIDKVQSRDANGVYMYETEEKVYNVAKMPTEVMRNIRGREITMIFQEPMTSLNPIFTIGNQLDEVVFLHVPGATKESAKNRTFEMLRLVGIIPENVYDRYPHELSGGMRQRVMIAMALSCHPKLIIADEPTTALDVTIQAQILDLLRDIKAQINGSIMFITHDLGVIAEMADYVVVMYAGRVIEKGTAKEVFDHPLHPYTMGLQKSKPALNKKVDRLYSIPGNVPNPINMPDYCYFRDRCSMRCEKCSGKYPEKMVKVSPTHEVACHLYEQEDISDGNN